MDGAADLRDSKAESANKRDVCFVCFIVFWLFLLAVLFSDVLQVFTVKYKKTAHPANFHIFSNISVILI